mmetsp:Transcript_9238/g.28775  ORF Transcript_9238/g.28775 Transcript_9238/m.28775 type:complete len:104 (+) Transcript_9238:696-1007(+)
MMLCRTLLVAASVRAFAPRPATTRRLAISASRDELGALTVPQLKERLRASGLKLGGRKAELVDRLLDSAGAAAAEVATPAVGGPTAPAASPTAPALILRACKQ